MAAATLPDEQRLREQVAALESFVEALRAQKARGVLTQAEVAADLILELVDQEVQAIAFQVHRNVKLRLLCLCPADNSDHRHHGLVATPGYDIYGTKLTLRALFARPDDGTQLNKQQAPSFRCPNCGMMRQPAKFAPHLEQCMGMGGRESRRAAAHKSRQLIQQQAGPDAPENKRTKKRSNGKGSYCMPANAALWNGHAYAVVQAHSEFAPG
ncbi:uncharacterized protein MONBRDRAFT_24279 [Monosiga brevicollis MX1]|uniref:SAGA-associated factor 11 n=1 Tax=Monosiga brevicollis TaxID=81824 RepID=A9UVY1_MONBE|nr:uncharacterized protein MONBRDRAFT_24279 [Monosiga brevicollis MX1]EDQ90469.1 predicted protein [Monosiga brevicollis MX1]|eukprot:XP_001744520.1 hypothetical protein [Monosiga brevicollis MX1]